MLLCKTVAVPMHLPTKRCKPSVDASTLVSCGTEQQRVLQAIPVNANVSLEKKQKTETAALRFAIGDQVECNMQMDGWLRGVVVALHDKTTQVRCASPAVRHDLFEIAVDRCHFTRR